MPPLERRRGNQIVILSAAKNHSGIIAAAVDYLYYADNPDVPSP
jgi:hypothetical protein